MEAVDSSFIIGSHYVIRGKIVEIIIFCGKLIEMFFPKSVERIDLIACVVVKTQMWKIRIFDKQYGYVGMSFMYDFEERDQQGVDLFDINIGDAVKHYESRIRDGSNNVGDFEIELAVAAEAEVDHFAVETACEDVGVSHTRAVGAAALQKACTIEYNLPTYRRQF